MSRDNYSNDGRAAEELRHQLASLREDYATLAASHRELIELVKGYSDTCHIMGLTLPVTLNEALTRAESLLQQTTNKEG